MRYFLCFMLLAITAVPAAAAELLVHSNNGFVVSATVNGTPVRLRLDPETSDYVVLNPSAAARVKLKPSLLRAETKVGPVRIRARSKAATISINGTSFQKRVVWPDRQVVDGADGLIGPGSIPFDRVIFRLSNPKLDERGYQVPLKFDGLGLYFPYWAGEEIRVQFSLARPESMATASAGSLLAAKHHGSWHGEPVTQHIKYGVSRPTRMMQLAAPLSINGILLNKILVRTADHRGNYDLPLETSDDPEEIVVTAAVRSRQRAVLSASIGLDILSACSSLVYERASSTMTLTCGETS